MEFFHILNRGVEKRNIVLNDSDRLRFVRGLYIFNDKKSADRYSINKANSVMNDIGNDERDPLVHIHAWCLMNNHYHLLLSPVDDDISNLSVFLKKLNMGYAKYFNEKYDRNGYFWQGKHKRIHIKRDSHFMHIPYYIHLNPLDYTHPKWRFGKVPHPGNTIKALKKYKWSSHLDHLGYENFPKIITKEPLSEIFMSQFNQEREMHRIISDFKVAQNSNYIE